MECPNCGAYNEEESKTCIVCGAALPAGAEKPRPEKTASEKTPAPAALSRIFPHP